jgi:hypothetical protein
VTVAVVADRPSALGEADRYQLELFDAWTGRFLEEASAVHRPVLARFLRWGLRRRLLHAIALDALRPWSCRGARIQARQAFQFLEWLDARHVTLDTCRQADIDAWFADGPTTRKLSAAFLTWAIQQHLCDRRLRLPILKSAAPTPMPADQRVELIGRLVADAALRLDDRVAGLLVTLYAQPATRITRLRLTDLVHHDGVVELDIGGEAVHVVAPLDGLIVELAARRTAQDIWLFPGATPGQPLNPKTLAERLVRIGVTRAARVAALHDLIREVPGPVLAPLIGYNPNFLAERAATLAVPWANYPVLRSRT